MARKLFIQTHGCQMNEYDSTRMVDLLESTHNLEPTDNPEDADELQSCHSRAQTQSVPCESHGPKSFRGLVFYIDT